MKEFYTIIKVDKLKGDKYVSNSGAAFDCFLSEKNAKEWIKKNGDEFALYRIIKMYHNDTSHEEQKETLSLDLAKEVAIMAFKFGVNGFTEEQVHKFINGALK